MSAAGPAARGGVRLRPAAARSRDRREGVAATEAFSRGDAIDRDWMGWGALRVLSHQQWEPGAVREGRVANMERLLLVLDGVLDADCGQAGRHRVATGGALWIGSGHGLASRLANAAAAPLRLVELWLQPDRVNAPPGAGTWMPAGDGPDAVVRAGGWQALAEPGGAGALPLRQAARVLLACPMPGAALQLPASAGARYWLEILEGRAVVAREAAAVGAGGQGPLLLGAGDGLGWLAGDAGRPAAVGAAGDAPVRLLLVALPA